jgi:hypothetical protein
VEYVENTAALLPFDYMREKDCYRDHLDDFLLSLELVPSGQQQCEHQQNGNDKGVEE